jgi:hypothetical protein
VTRTLARLLGRGCVARLGALSGAYADVGDVVLEGGAPMFGAARHAGEAGGVAPDGPEGEQRDECFSLHVLGSPVGRDGTDQRTAWSR